MLLIIRESYVADGKIQLSDVLKENSTSRPFFIVENIPEFSLILCQLMQLSSKFHLLHHAAVLNAVLRGNG
jgi:hypothetical protein